MGVDVEDDDVDDDFLTKKVVSDDDDDRGNDSSISMIDNLIDQFEFDLLELQNDISSHFDSFSTTTRSCQQEQEQHYDHEYEQYHPCKRIMTKEECDGILPLQQTVRTDTKKCGNNKNNTNVPVASTMKFVIDPDDDASDSTQLIIIPHHNSSSALSKYMSYSKFFIHQKWCIL